MVLKAYPFGGVTSCYCIHNRKFDHGLWWEKLHVNVNLALLWDTHTKKIKTMSIFVAICLFTFILILSFLYKDDSGLWPWHTYINIHLLALQLSLLSSRLFLFRCLSLLLLFCLWNLKISHLDYALYILLPWWLTYRASTMCVSVCACICNVCLCASGMAMLSAEHTLLSNFMRKQQ